MNATIERIVGLLFEDIEESEEVRAIHEEVLTNCQERYEDLRSSGLSDDEATAAVIESLKGMEEMLKPYPRRQVQKEESTENAFGLTIDPAQNTVCEIDLKQMKNANISVQTSPDQLLHLSCSDSKCTFESTLQNGVLTISRTDRRLNAEAHVEFELNDIGALFQKLANRLATALNQLGGIRLTLQLPPTLRPALCIETTSGEIDLSHVELARLRVCAASSDISIVGCRMQEMNISTASGDIEVERTEITCAAQIASTSGDVDWLGDCPSLSVRSVSGDMQASGVLDDLAFKTVSGDVRAVLHGPRLRMVQGRTVSGDVSLSLPVGVEANIICRTTSGDIRQRPNSVPHSPVHVEISTVSGDINVK